MWAKNAAIFLAIALATQILLGCAKPSLPHLKNLSYSTLKELAKKGMSPKSPIFVRIFKEESELEVWKPKADGRYHLFKTYPICKWSGKLGPKRKTGDKQAPEGFYKVSNGALNPSSRYYLSFNIGYPNRYDKAHGRTGAHLMVHGNCQSKGCYAMTDALMEEIYLLARDAFIGGQKQFEVHAFPFRMTKANMKRHRRHRWIRFWKNIKDGYDQFELTRKPPKIDVCGKKYVVNANFSGNPRLHSTRPCPRYRKITPNVYFGETTVESTEASMSYKGNRPYSLH